MKKVGGVALVVVFLLIVGACQSSSRQAQNKANNAERNVSAKILNNFEQNQPPPVRPWSQLRQNLIELETAQADTTQTTTFFFNLGIREPVQSCPSIGFPIASTSQITNPSQIVGSGGSNSIPQIDPNGIYSGNSTGTYVICVDAKGRAYADYWEGFVQTVTGPAVWNAKTGSVDLVGPPSFKFSTEKKP